MNPLGDGASTSDVPPTIGTPLSIEIFASAPPAPPEHVGPYRILQPLGEGGFGTVYLAEQREPIQRRVALKLIKPGMDSRAVIARFEAERQAMALMSHPNIAQVFDAGTTPDGRPYFVMEHVAGLPLTEHCDLHRLSIDDRLKLFRSVAEAIQHAHQKGVIHRDLKPSNILVGIVDGAPIVKVIDFGVAKALRARLTEKTVYTEIGQLIGTPEYMSPEQADLTAQDIDTRSDIYSLGVMLYELLTGALPFDSRTLRSAGYAEIQRIIREVDPPRPSTRLSQATTRADEASRATREHLARTRRCNARELTGALRRDLDWVVMKCLEKVPARRYTSAQELADEIGRYLSHEPVIAGPPGTAYRMSRFVRRHRALVGGGAAVFGALAIGLAGTLHFLVKAQNEGETSMAVEDALSQILSSGSPEHGGADFTVSEALASSVNHLTSTLDDQPHALGRLLAAVGQTYASLGETDNAMRQIDRAIELVTQVEGDSPRVAELRMVRAGIAAREAKGRDDVAEVHRQLDLAQRSFDDLVAHGQLDTDSSIRGRNTLANLAKWAGSAERAEKLYLENLRLLTARGLDEGDVALQTRYNLALLRAETLLDPGAGASAEQRAAAIAELRLVEEDSVAQFGVHEIRALEATSERLKFQHRWSADRATALPAFGRDYVGLFERMHATLGPAHWRVAEIAYSIGTLHRDAGSAREAADWYLRAYSIYRSSKPAFDSMVVKSAVRATQQLVPLGEKETAIALIRAVLAECAVQDPKVMMSAAGDLKEAMSTLEERLREIEGSPAGS